MGRCGNVIEGVNQLINLDEGWSGVSSYITPFNNDFGLENFFQSIQNEIIILQSPDAFWYPDQNINTIGQWNTYDGYKIKVLQNCQLNISGWIETFTEITLDEGWNLIPVISECDADVEDLFAETELTIAKEVAGYLVYWPDMGINTLEYLVPGAAYFVMMGEDGEITFPECENLKSDAGDLSGLQDLSGLSGLTPWAIQKPTAITHIIAIPISAVREIEINNGDILGTFDSEGKCFGITQWQNQNTSITLFGDDPLTQEKDGFSENDIITLRVYNSETKKETESTATWDQTLPQHDGLFHTNGLSSISELKVSAAGYQHLAGEDVLIFPNPAKDQLNIIVPEPDGQKIIIVNIHGQQVYSGELINQHTKVDISHFERGLYFIQVLSEKYNLVRKVVKE